MQATPYTEPCLPTYIGCQSLHRHESRAQPRPACSMRSVEDATKYNAISGGSPYPLPSSAGMHALHPTPCRHRCAQARAHGRQRGLAKGTRYAQQAHTASAPHTASSISGAGPKNTVPCSCQTNTYTTPASRGKIVRPGAKITHSPLTLSLTHSACLPAGRMPPATAHALLPAAAWSIKGWLLLPCLCSGQTMLKIYSAPLFKRCPGPNIQNLGCFNPKAKS